MPIASHYSIFEPEPEAFAYCAWFTGEEALTPEECKVLQVATEDMEQGDWGPGIIGGGVVNSDYRKVGVFKLPIHADDEIAAVQKKIIDAVRRANDGWWQFAIDHLSFMEVLRYGEGDGYRKHVDWYPMGRLRKLSASVILSDPEGFDGGDLEIITGDGEADIFTAPREQGAICVFPSFLLHRVTQVTRGERWAATAWFEGPRFR